MIPDYTEGGLVKGPVAPMEDNGTELIVPLETLRKIWGIPENPKAVSGYAASGFHITSYSDVDKDSGQVKKGRTIITVEPGADKAEVIEMLKSIWNVQSTNTAND